MTSSFHYWSSDPTGQHPLSAKLCKDLGLPIELFVGVWSTYRYRWNNNAYKWMHQYQLDRGFDANTSDFARHLGWPVYQVQSDPDRFEEDVDGPVILPFHAAQLVANYPVTVTMASPTQSSPIVSDDYYSTVKVTSNETPGSLICNTPYQRHSTTKYNVQAPQLPRPVPSSTLTPPPALLTRTNPPAGNETSLTYPNTSEELWDICIIPKAQETR